MIRASAALILFLLMALPLSAQAVRVSSGEHEGFTRLVLEFSEAVEWRFGRTSDGYELRVAGKSPAYDLTQAFQLIGRNRLAALWSDPENGALDLTVACACHAIPFEFRPGTIVIDLRDGPPPKGSSFETPLEGGELLADLEEAAPPRPQPTPAKTESTTPTVPAEAAEQAKPPEGPVYRWTDTLLLARKTDSAPSPALALLDRSLARPEKAASGLEPLRQSLIEELGRGATQGIVDMAEPEAGGAHGPETPTESPEFDALAGQSQVAITLGDEAHLTLRHKGETPLALTGQGVACIADEQLLIAEWAAERAVSEQIGTVLDGLVGEFDRPDAEAVGRSVRFYLALGFGAEAREILRAFPSEQEDQLLWATMADIVDERPIEGENAFAGMAACETSAALWALLADPEVLALGQVEKAAVLRSFSALPRHLRHHFGPRLVERFLEMKDIASATALRDSVQRGTETTSQEAEMMDAALEAAGGSPAASATRLANLVEDQGNSDSEVLAELVIRRAELGQTVSYDQIVALESYAGEHGDGPEKDHLELALTLAHAASGNFESAFERLDQTPNAAPVVWDLLARSGRDTPLLEQAVLPSEEPLPKAARPVATLIAQRLISLGLAEQAARWLDMESDPPPILAARIALGQGNAERALALLGEDRSKLADEVRMEAFVQQGDEAAIAALFAEQGMTEQAVRAWGRKRNWEQLAAKGTEAWQAAARRLPGLAREAPNQVGLEEIGPLERDRRLLAESESTRADLAALLDSLEAPQPVSQ